MTSGDSGLDVYGNVGPALEDAHIQEMKRLGVKSITSSFETMNERVFFNGGKICDAGEPETVLTPENIRSVYGVEAEVVYRLWGEIVHRSDKVGLKRVGGWNGLIGT